MDLKMDLNRRFPNGFIVDAMFHKLGRFLRVIGTNVELADTALMDPVIMEMALKSKRILITRDLPFFQIMKKKIKEITGNDTDEINDIGPDVIYVNKQQVIEQLVSLFQQLHIDPKKMIWEVGEKLPFETRCVKCNGVLDIVDKNTIIDLIPKETAKYHNTFWKCECGKIYWRGKHFQDIRKQFLTVIEQTDQL
jgi:uncharacterized protein